MTDHSDAMPESAPVGQGAAASFLSKPRPLYWSIRRELWENRSIYSAVIIAAAVVIFGFLINTIFLPDTMREFIGHRAQITDLTKPYHIAAISIIITELIVGVFYCLGALHGERRDRSILFWKSLPVSDLTTVLSKACIPMVVLPLVTFAAILATQLIMLLWSTLVLIVHGLSAAPVWIEVTSPAGWLLLLYSLTVLALWHAPIYGWLLLVSVWARRATFLWAVLPPLGLCVAEEIAFSTAHFASFLGDRLVGGFGQAFADRSMGRNPIDELPIIDLVKFLSTPGLWVGLAVAGAFFAAAVRLRRYREPI